MDDHSFHTSRIRRKLAVFEELAATGTVAHLGDPPEIAVLRGPKKRAKTECADARLLPTFAAKRG